MTEEDFAKEGTKDRDVSSDTTDCQAGDNQEKLKEERSDKRKRIRGHNSNFVKDTILTLVLIICFWKIGTAYSALPNSSKGVLQKAEVVEINEVKYLGSDESLKDIKYKVRVKFISIFIPREKDLYYVKDPELHVGDVIQVRVDLLDSDKVYSVVQE